MVADGVSVDGDDDNGDLDQNKKWIMDKWKGLPNRWESQRQPKWQRCVITLMNNYI